MIPNLSATPTSITIIVTICGVREREDMAAVEVTEEDADDWTEWRWNIHCGDPWWEKPKYEEVTR